MQLNKEDLDHIYNLKLEGYSWAYIEDLFNFSTRSIRDTLVKNKYDITIFPKCNNRCKCLTKEKAEYAKKLKLEGKSTEEISKIIGCYTAQLKRIGISYINTSSKERIRYDININYFDDIKTDKQAYFLGLIAADGNVNTKRLKIELKDKEILEVFRDEVCPNKPIYIYNRKGKNVIYDLSFDNKYFITSLEKWNIYPRKSYIPSSLPNLSFELMSSFVRGYFDGNGSVFSDKKTKALRIKFIGNAQFINELRMLLNLDLKIHTTDNNFTSYFTIAKFKEVEKFYKFIYQNSSEVCLFRKYSRFKDYYENLKADSPS